MTLPDSDRLLVVPADALMARATRLANGESIVTVVSGLDVQPLTPAIAKATGARTGVVVRDVSPAAVSSVTLAAGGGGASASGAGAAGAGGSAGAGNSSGARGAGGAAAAPGSGGAGQRNGGAHISVGDVITVAAGRPVGATRDWQQILRAQAAGATIAVSIVRFGRPLQASLTLPRPNSAPSGSAGGAGAASGTGASGTTGAAATAGASSLSALDVMGLSLRGVTGGSGGSEVIAIHPASPAARTGLRTGDRITSLPGRASSTSPSPSAIATACDELASGQALLLAIDRGGAARIAALEKP
jgi:pilus assembly protein FimV